MHFPNTKTDYSHTTARLAMVQTATPVPLASIGSFVLLQHAHGPDRVPLAPETGLH